MKLSDEVTDAITKHLPGVVKSGLTLLERALNITDSVLDVVGEKARRAAPRRAARSEARALTQPAAAAIASPARGRRRPARAANRAASNEAFDIRFHAGNILDYRYCRTLHTDRQPKLTPFDFARRNIRFHKTSFS